MQFKSIATAKVAAVTTGLAMAASMLTLAPLAHAQVVPGACVASTVSAITNLSQGATGASVASLQLELIAAGYVIPAITSGAAQPGYFGSQTVAAVTAAQVKLGVNAGAYAGYFGPSTRAALAASCGGSVTTTLPAGCTTTAGFSSTTGLSCAVPVTGVVPGCVVGAMFSSTTGQSCASTTTVPGCVAGALFSSTTGQSCGATPTTGGALTGAGRLTNITSLGNVTTNVKEGDAAMSVLGVSADATGGDVSLQRVDVTMTIGGSTGSSNLDKYVSDVSLYLDGTKIGSMDAANGDKNGRVWTLRFSNLDGVIRANKTGNLYVKVTPVSGVGTNENGVTVTAAIISNGIRAVAADGISDTYGSGYTHDFNVSTATTGTANVSTASDNPAAGSTVAVSTTATTLTSGVMLLSLNVKAQNSDLIVDELPIHLSTSDNNLGDVVSTVYLMKGSSVLSTKSVTNGVSTTTFTNLNQTIAKDATANYTIKVDLNGTGSAYAEGTTITASSTTYGWDIQDDNGNSVTPTGSVTGNDVTLRSIGLVASANPVAATATKSGNGTNTQETGSFTFTFDAQAFGADMYVSSTTNGFTPITVYDTTGTATTTTAYSITSTATRSAGNNYVIYSGTTKPITISFTKLGQNGYVYAKLTTLKFGTSDVTALANSLTFPTSYQTPQIYLAN